MRGTLLYRVKTTMATSEVATIVFTIYTSVPGILYLLVGEEAFDVALQLLMLQLAKAIVAGSA